MFCKLFEVCFAKVDIENSMKSIIKDKERFYQKMYRSDEWCIKQSYLMLMERY